MPAQAHNLEKRRFESDLRHLEVKMPATGEIEEVPDENRQEHEAQLAQRLHQLEEQRSRTIEQR